MQPELTPERAARAAGVFNATAFEPVDLGGGWRARYLHCGVTPPSYWRSGRHPSPCEVHKHPYFEACHAPIGRGGFTTWAPDLERPVRAGDTAEP
ncbi:MAG: hypothetical protein M5U26_07985 [Planctomycetota bacterium]|nr:hypothetical protein [Planctomycetota bacterium]